MPEHAGNGRTSKGTMVRLFIACCLAALLVTPLVRAAGPNEILSGQKLDMKVLLMSADGTEPGFGAWKAELEREGVPYDTFVAYDGANRAQTLTDATLADYGADHAKYQAVILASGDLGRNLTNRNQTTSYLSALTDGEWSTLAKFERTFAIRQISDYTAPSPAHGLTISGGTSQDGRTGTLTAAGKQVFPYLKGPIPVADVDPAQPNEAFGYEGTPVNAADWKTLVSGPSATATNDTAYLGVYTHPDDGREELVMTLASNEYQSHNQALRHGMLNWATRGVFLGYQRSYLELDVDDVFLGDDKWDADANVTNYDFETAIRMNATDVANAVAWQQRSGLRLNMVYNLGGNALYGGATDPLLGAFQANKNQFTWINHTLDHPNLDCTTQAYTQAQLTQNQALFNSLIGPVSPGLNDPGEAVTGEHSGLANTRPGNPGTIDPPSFDDLVDATGSLATGTYQYAITASSPAGETVASMASADVTTGGITATFNAVCHAVKYTLYRQTAGGWTQIDTLARGARDAVDNGSAPIELSITDDGTATAGATLPTSNLAALVPYNQNPAYVPALQGAGIATVASDASKPYPNPPGKPNPSEADPTNFAKGATFPLAPGLGVVPRYPTNVYYNVANRADQLDEYNYIYTAPAGGGGCVPIANVTTCNAAPVTWQQYLDSETRIMLGHLAGNDPRPHYFHQTNIAQSDLSKPATDTTVGGTLYALVDTVLASYDQVYDRGTAPLLQLSHRQIAANLVQQDAWAATRRGGKVSAYLQDGVVHVANGGTTAVDVPVTGTTAGTDYAGQKSGWITVAPGATSTLQSILPRGKARPAAPKRASAKKKKKAAKRAKLKLKRVRVHPRKFRVAHRRARLGTRLDGAAISWRVNKRAKLKFTFQRRKRSGHWKQVGKMHRRARPTAGVLHFRGRFHKNMLKPGRYRVLVKAKRKGHHSVTKKVKFKVRRP